MSSSSCKSWTGPISSFQREEACFLEQKPHPINKDRKINAKARGPPQGHGTPSYTGLSSPEELSEASLQTQAWETKRELARLSYCG